MESKYVSSLRQIGTALHALEFGCKPIVGHLLSKSLCVVPLCMLFVVAQLYI